MQGGPALGDPVKRLAEPSPFQRLGSQRTDRAPGLGQTLPGEPGRGVEVPVPLGRIVRTLMRRRLRTMWPQIAGDRLLGVGYATPYLRPFRDEAERVMGFMPARQGVVNWPAEGPSATALVEDTNLPLPTSSIYGM